MNIENIKLKAAELARVHNLDMIVLFGSRADNTAGKTSDVDIAYGKSEPLSFDEQLSIGSELAPFFGTEAADVVHLNSASPSFMYQIMKKAIVLFSKDSTI